MPRTRATLSVAIVCKDNQSTIGRTLDSVRPIADEIIAVDSGSTDGTRALLESARVQVISSPWLGHIKTKQLALESCTKDWALSIDSDESVDEPLARAITDVLETDHASTNGFLLNRQTWYKGRPLKYAWQPEWRLRLVRRGRAKWGGLDPHDKLELLPGQLDPLELHPGTIRHDSFPTFAEHLRKQHRHATTMAQSLFATGVRTTPSRLWVSPAGAFFKQLVLKRGYKDGVPGWLAAASTASAALTKHAVLLELSHEDTARPGAVP